ncbi:MAG TPA: GNAT family N-acetyltransferase [Aliiroseovarius sp.]|nr:GNAT family N-acetyltransferase [Aliiroseovarius sp.]
MKPRALSALYRAAFPDARPWSTAEFAGLLARPETILAEAQQGFALGRVIADEAELITLAVHPHARRRGLGRSLLARFEAEAGARGARSAFLEVAADNGPAMALYLQAGWRESGRRKGYYARRGQPAADALTLQKSLPVAPPG